MARRIRKPTTASTNSILFWGCSSFSIGLLIFLQLFVNLPSYYYYASSSRQNQEQQSLSPSYHNLSSSSIILKKEDKEKKTSGSNATSTSIATVSPQEEKQKNVKNIFATVSFKEENIVYSWMHVPKTSGTTSYNRFMILLQEKLNVTVTPPTHGVDKDGVKQLANKGHVMELPCQTGKKKEFAPGVHCAASEIADCVENIAYPNHKTKFLTVLRHPVDRVISEYYWWLKTPMQWTESMNSVKYDGIDSWVKDPMNIAHNRQAMYFLLDKKYPTNEKLSPHETMRTRHCIPYAGAKALEWIRSKYGSVEKFNNISVSDDYAIDFWGLNRFAFIGIMEDMTTSEKKLREVFGIEEEGEEESTKELLGGRHAANYKKEDISLETRKLIEERNRLDMILYNKIKKDLYVTTTSRG